MIFDLFSLFDLLKCLITIFVFFIIRGPLTYIIVKFFNIKEKDKSRIKETSVYKPIKLFFLILGVYLGLKFINFNETIVNIIDKIFRMTIILLIAKSLVNMTSSKSKFITRLNKKLKMSNSSNITGMISKIISAIIYAFAGVIIINELGYDVNGLVAGLGLGGLTIALAAQDAASNMFGGLVIIFDKPFEIGDWIKTGTVEGIVEEITFRSTRIRLFDNTLVIIPNNKITNDTLVNCSKMEKRRIKFDLQLDMNVDMKKLNSCLQKVKKMILETENIIDDSVLVFFDRIEDSGYNMFVSCFTSELSYADYMKVKENMNYKLIEILNKEKISLAYPSKTVYLRQDETK